LRSENNWSALEQAVKNHPRPVVGVDVDNVIFSTRSWAANVLRGYEHSVGTNNFKNLRYGPVGDTVNFILQYLAGKIADRKKLTMFAENASRYLESSFHSSYYSRTTTPLRGAVQKLLELRKKHPKVRFAFITARPPGMRAVTELTLSEVGFAESLKAPWGLNMVGDMRDKMGQLLPTPTAKSLSARQIAAQSGGQVVGFLDDRRDSVVQLENDIAGLVGLWIHTVPTADTEEVYALRTNEIPLGYYSLALQPCQSAYDLTF
jgi:hypothetical protein